MPKKKKLAIGTTISKTIIRHYETYDLVERVWADGEGGSVSTREWQTKNGHTIDTQWKKGRRTGLMKVILRKSLAPEPASPGSTQCSIGRAPDGTWYGWSHRAMCGFKPGRDYAFDETKLKDDTPFTKSTNRLIKTERGARNSAIRFARSVS